MKPPSCGESASAGWPGPAQWFLLLAGYFAVQIVSRSLVSSSVDLDESEQLVLSQAWHWSYASELPLYTWIQILFFKLFGTSVFSLALFKNLLLFGTYAFTYLNARWITRSDTGGIMAAAALLFIPQVAWESQRDLTHSVLVSTLAAASLLFFLRLQAGRRIGDYLAFGFCAGLGLLSKYNFDFILVGLLIAAVSVREFRSAVLDRRMWVSAALAAILFLPTGIWILQHRDLASLSTFKFQIAASESWGAAVARGLFTVGKSTLTFVGPLGVVLVAVFWGRPASAPAGRPEYRRLLVGMVAASYGLIGLLVLVFRATDIRERWLQPVLISAPVLAVALLERRLDGVGRRRALVISAVVMLALAAAIPGRLILAERLHRTEPLNRPYDALAGQIREVVAPVPVVVADTEVLAGNLRMNLRDKVCVMPSFAALFVEEGSRYALVWDATRDAAPPAVLREFARRTGPAELKMDQARYFSATFKYHRVRQMRLGVLVVPE